MSCVSILRIGPFPVDNDYAHNLREAILKYLTEGTAAVDQVEPQPKHQFSITNRYFTADVRLAGMDDEASSDTSGTDAATTNSTLSLSEDGMILVFDAERSHPKYATSITSSFDAMELIHDQAIMNSKCGELLRLCVSVGNNRVVQYNGMTQQLSDKEYEDEYSRRILWCLDRGYEYIEVPDLLDTSQGHDARDKDGFARIIEAISGTVWTSAIMAPKQKQTLQHSFAETRKDIINNNNNNNNNIKSTPDSSASLQTDRDATDGGYEPPNPLDYPSIAVDENDQERERKAHEALLANCMTETTTSATDTTAVVDAINGTSTTKETNSEEMRQERAMHALEASLSEARRIRELSISGQLSDEERRKRATDAAMLIMQTMEQMGFNEDDDDDDDNDIDEDDNSIVDEAS